MRYIGFDPLYAEGEALRAKGDIEGARRIHERYLTKYPLSMAGQFVIGLESYALKDWTRSAQAYGTLEKYFPDHLGILYNYALALMELKEYSPAIDRLKFVAARDPGNYAVQINLYYTYIKAGAAKRAKATLVTMKNSFPNDAEVTRLLATAN
jgi:predicted Zn-dependent protease